MGGGGRGGKHTAREHGMDGALRSCTYEAMATLNTSPVITLSAAYLFQDAPSPPHVLYE